jgi:hypothetical protein
MDNVTLMHEEARECERIASLERDQARIDRLIEAEGKRRLEIASRLSVEIRRLGVLRRAV